MRFFTKVLIVFTAIYLLQITIMAEAVAATEEKIKVTVATTIQEQIQQLNPHERKRIESAIRIGNLFIPRYFDGSANNLTDDLSVKAWRKNIRPLVNKDFTKWAEMVDEEGSGIELNIAGKAATEAGLCPQAELMSFQIEAGQVNLKYRARVIGATQIEKRTYRLQGGLLIDEKEDYQEAQVGLDKSNKVDYVAPKYMGFFVTTDFLVETYDSHIDLLKNRLASLPPDEQIRVNEEIKQHKDWIKLINEQVAQVCTAQ